MAQTIQSDSIMNMNNSSAKFSRWVVRVRNPRVVRYSFTARGETVKAEKFRCHLVGDQGQQYVEAGVPFDFKQKDKAQTALKNFKLSSNRTTLTCIDLKKESSNVIKNNLKKNIFIN